MAKLLRKSVVIILLQLGSSYLLNSQASELKFERLSPIASPNCFLQDKFGFIWIGAQEGLIKYDGLDYKRFTNMPFDSTSLSFNWVTVLKEDTQGNLWVGTWSGGLNYFDQRTEKFTRFKGGTGNQTDISKSNISDIIVNEDGSLWVGTKDQGLFYIYSDSSGQKSYKKYEMSPHSESLNNSEDISVLCLHKDKNNKLWIGTSEKGLKCLNPVTGELLYFEHDIQNPASISCNTVNSICEDDSGNLWIGTGYWMNPNGRGLNKFDLKTKIFSHFKHSSKDPFSICGNNISSVIIDKQNMMWIGTVENNICSIPVSELLHSKDPHFTSYSALAGKQVQSIYEDRTGNIWIAIFSGVVYKYSIKSNPFVAYQPIDKNTYNAQRKELLWLIYPDKSGKIWFGYQSNELYCYDPEINQYTHYENIPSQNTKIKLSKIMGMCEDNFGNFWISLFGKGLIRFNPTTGESYTYKANQDDEFGLLSDNIVRISTSRSGDIWIVMQKSGLQLFDIETNRFYKFDIDTTTNADNEIFGFTEDSTGTVWVGTWSNGLYSLKLKDHKIIHTQHYLHDPSNRNTLSSNLVGSILRPTVVDTSAVWLTTNNGLNRLDLNTGIITHLTIEDGLPSNMTMMLLEDNDGNIWCSGKGIAVYNVHTGKILSYNESDGLPFNGFGGFFQNAAKTVKGQLLFGGHDQALGFYPEQLKNNQTAPPIYLNDFKIFHESATLDTVIQFKKTITLNYEQNVFSFGFAALDFTNPSKNQYAYKMEGFNNDWINIGNERTIGFTNLDPGKYVFRVKGSINHGAWNKKGASLNIIILPPWWKTNWAYFAYLFVIISIIFSLRRYDLKRQRLKHELEVEHLYTEKLREVDRLKSRFFANISHEFRTPLTLLLGPISRLLGKISDREDVKDLQVMHKNAKRLQKLINELLDLSQIEEGKLKLHVQETDIVHFINRIVQTFESQAEIKNIKLKLKTELIAQPVFMDTAKMENVFYNLLSNAFKFTPQGGVIEVTISLPGISKIGVTKQSQDEIATTAIRQSRDDNNSKDCIQITVSNTGSVIPSEKINHIFDRFYQVDDSFTREYEGSGIGLALTNELIKLHHGAIEVESNSESGTIFTITLPLGKQHFAVDEINKETIIAENDTEMNIIQVPVDIDEEYDAEHSKKLLIVEDNEDMRGYIKSCFKSDYFIIEAQDGFSGFDKSVNELPDLIISDVMMPKMDGFQLCEKIKSDERTSHIPVILLTARAEMKDKINGLDTGADDYVVKPFEVMELQARVRNLILQRQKLQQQFKKNEEYLTNELALTSQDEKFLNKAIKIIENKMSDTSFDVETFVNEIGISRAHLYHKFKTITGQSVKDFVRTIRLKRSLQMLKNNTGNISEIAYEVGFSNPAYFSKCFREQFGYSPSQYSRQ